MARPYATDHNVMSLLMLTNVDTIYLLTHLLGQSVTACLVSQNYKTKNFCTTELADFIS